MIGLIMFVAFGVYLVISFGVVWLVVRWARKTGRGVKRWAAAAILVMYLLVFWDHIPTLVLYKYYCNTKAGFWVYKTPEQWKAENPGVVETLMWEENPPHYEARGVTRGYKLNERFVWLVRVSKSPVLPVRITHESIVDLKNDETVVERIRVGAGYVGNKEIFRFWTTMEPCIPSLREFNKSLQEFHKLGRKLK